jgi:hypothetical protein
VLYFIACTSKAEGYDRAIMQEIGPLPSAIRDNPAPLHNRLYTDANGNLSTQTPTGEIKRLRAVDEGAQTITALNTEWNEEATTIYLDGTTAAASLDTDSLEDGVVYTVIAINIANACGISCASSANGILVYDTDNVSTGNAWTFGAMACVQVVKRGAILHTLSKTGGASLVS